MGLSKEKTMANRDYDSFEYEDDDGYFVDKDYRTSNSWYTAPIRSTSEYLRNSYWGDFYNQRYQERQDRADTEEALHEVLRELNKTVNLTSNSYDGKEAIITVKYSNGKVHNDLLGNELYVSPSIILNEELSIVSKDGDYYGKLDGLHGQALLSSFIRKNIAPKAAQSYKDSDKWAVRNIFMTDLQSLASNEVYSSWPGFMSYVTQQQIVFGQDKKKILENIQHAEKLGIIKFDDFVELLAYNRLAADRIDYSIFNKDMQQIFNKADAMFNNMLNEKTPNEKRFEKAQEVYDKLVELLNPDNVQSENGSAVAVNMENSELSRPMTGDNSYNNHSNIEGDIISATLDHNTKLREYDKHIDDSLNSNILSKETILTDRTYKLVIPAVNPETVQEYEKRRAANKKMIRDIKTAFQFKNNIPVNQTYGLSAGELDENSLYKIHLEEYEKLYQRRDMFEAKKYHVTIALDQSSSMCGRIREASRLGIIIAEALREMRNVEFSVYGFNTHMINTIVYQDKNYQKLEALSEANSSGSTALGYHIAAIADKVYTQYHNHDKKIMFVITDGVPTHGSTNLTAIEHTSYSVKLTRNMGIDVFGIGIMNAFTEKVGNDIFGKGNYAVIQGIKETLPILVTKLKKYLQRMI